MAISHKSRVVIQYLIPLAGFYSATVAFFYSSQELRLADYAQAVGGAGLVAVALSLAQDIVPKPLKEFIVFWRARDRLPGHRCFLTENDQPSRFDRKKIPNIRNLSVASPAAQQIAFFNFYKTVSKESAVEHYSFRYLAWRDTASTALILAIITVPSLGFLTVDALIPAVKISAIMASFCVLAILAARQMAQELINQVFAYVTGK